MRKFLNWLKEAGMEEEGVISGLSSIEISELSEAQGQVELPNAYIEFLMDCGKSAGLYQRDAIFFFPEIKNLKHQLFEMLADEGIELSVSENIFVFGSYQGFQFHYFVCDGSSDPAVYQIDDSGDAPTLVASKFSDYIKTGIEQYRDAFYKKT